MASNFAVVSPLQVQAEAMGELLKMLTENNSSETGYTRQLYSYYIYPVLL